MANHGAWIKKMRSCSITLDFPARVSCKKTPLHLDLTRAYRAKKS